MNIIDIARECGARLACYESADSAALTAEFTESALTALESRIRADERERCAKLCEAQGRKTTALAGVAFYIATGQCAAAIRNSVHSDAAPVAEPESMKSHLTDGDGSQVQAL